MDKLITDLHALKTYLELTGHCFLAAQVDKQIQELRGELCHFCKQPIHTNAMGIHAKCLSELYDVVFEGKKVA